MNNHATLERIRGLKLSGMYQAFKLSIETREHENITADQLVALLVEAEYNHRNNLHMKMSIKRACFRYNATVEQVNYSVQRGVG